MTTFGSLFVRRVCWSVSRRGWVVLVSLVLAFGFAVRWEAYPFLAVNQPVDGEILIVEGWIGTEVLNQAAAEFARGKYRKLLVARPVYDNGRTYLHGRVSDDYFLLIKNGVPRESLDTVFYLASQRDRTYHSALAVKAWFVENGAFPKSFNVATMGAHARRSWLLYQEAFGNTA